VFPFLLCCIGGPASGAPIFDVAGDMPCGAPGPIATSPCTVPIEHVQYDGDFASASVGAGTRVIHFGDGLLKLPLSTSTELELSLEPWDIMTARSNGSARRITIQGPGDVGFGVKSLFLSSTAYSFAVTGAVTVPTARPGLGAGAMEAGFGAPIALSLPHRWSLTLNPQMTWETNATGSGHHLDISNLAALSSPPKGAWTALAEFDLSHDGHGGDRDMLILGADYTPRGQTQLHLDVGWGTSLTESTASMSYAAFSRRF